MPGWILPTIVFLVWTLYPLVGAAQLAAEDVRRGTPVAGRRGVSPASVIPLAPIAAWGLAWLGNRAADSPGTVVVGALHVALAVALVVSLARSWWYLRSMGYLR